MESEEKTPEQVGKELWEAQIAFKRVLAEGKKRKTLILKLTPSQADLIQTLIHIARGDIGQGCEYAKEKEKEIRQLFKRQERGMLFSFG